MALRKKLWQQVCVVKKGQEGQNRIKKIVKLWQKCTEIGDYMEKCLCTVVNKG